MNEFLIVSLILFGVVVVDAAGDAFRIHQWQLAHHIMEVVGIAVWIVLWKYFDFHWEYLIMYITGRIWVFDPLLNLIAGYRLTYAGKSSLYGRLLSWLMIKAKNPGAIIWVIRGLALVWWIAWLLTKADGRIF